MRRDFREKVLVALRRVGAAAVTPGKDRQLRLLAKRGQILGPKDGVGRQAAVADADGLKGACSAVLDRARGGFLGGWDVLVGLSVARRAKTEHDGQQAGGSTIQYDT